MFRGTLNVFRPTVVEIRTSISISYLHTRHAVLRFYKNDSLSSVKKEAKFLNYLQGVVQCNLPFSFVEAQTTRQNTNMLPITCQTFVSKLQKVVKQVEQNVSADLPSKFGTLSDCWSTHSDHCIARFA